MKYLFQLARLKISKQTQPLCPQLKGVVPGGAGGAIFDSQLILSQAGGWAEISDLPTALLSCQQGHK